MILMTFAITLTLYYIESLKNQFQKIYMTIIFMILGLIPILLALFVKKLRKNKLLIYGLFLLTVFFWSFALPPASIFAEKWSMLSCLVAIFTGLSSVEGGYKFKTISRKAVLVILVSAAVSMLLGVILFAVITLLNSLEVLKFVSGAFFVLGGMLVLFLVGKFLKECDPSQLSVMFPVWLALITWFGVISIYLTICFVFTLTLPKMGQHTSRITFSW
ncbi:unnamed protein product [Trichobilharzia szidati]|nr:unnamed protein product [Trichobilharzia szidati]